MVTEKGNQYQILQQIKFDLVRLVYSGIPIYKHSALLSENLASCKLQLK